MAERVPTDATLLAALAGHLPERPPSPETAARIKSLLMQRLAEPPQRVLRASEGEWEVIRPGIEIKRLRRDEQSETTLWRMAPGAELPAHAHHMDEECLVLEGSLVQGGDEFFPGDFVLALAGRDHAAFTSPRGALFLIRGELRCGHD
jgi:anti-sigma factor ChrR (cupin superfamily)